MEKMENYIEVLFYIFIKNNTFKNILSKNKQLNFIFKNGCSVETTNENTNRIKFEDIFG